MTVPLLIGLKGVANKNAQQFYRLPAPGCDAWLDMANPIRPRQMRDGQHGILHGRCHRGHPTCNILRDRAHLS